MPKTDLLKNKQIYGAKKQVISINFRYQWSHRDNKYLNLQRAESKLFLSSSMKTNALCFAKLYEVAVLQKRIKLLSYRHQ